MTASELKAGDKVFYLDDIPAKVDEVCKNGVRISYWLRNTAGEDQHHARRVSARALTPRAHPALTV